MTNWDTEIGRDYETMAFDRLTTTDPRWVTLPDVDWGDQPSRYKIYQGVERHLLTARDGKPLASFGSALSPQTTETVPLTPLRLSQLLFYSNGLLGRRMDLNWNYGNEGRMSIPRPTYSRGPASGGGLYPFEVYFVAGEEGPVSSGVYHYDNAHDSLDCIRKGDWTPAVRKAALNNALADDASDFLLVTNTFWKTAFKYASLAYHIVALDTGLYSAAAHFTARGLGLQVATLFWFDDVALANLAGLDPLYESVFAVVALRGASTRSIRSTTKSAAVPSVSIPFLQRSKRVIRFPLVEQIHEAALLSHEPRPDASAMATANFDSREVAGERLRLPALLQDRLGQSVDLVLRNRRSAFGSFKSGSAVSLAELATVLRTAVSAHEFVSDVKPAHTVTRFTRLLVMAGRVQGLEPAVYEYDAAMHALVKRSAGPYGAGLQSLYFLDNYNLDQAALAFLIVGNLDRMFEVYGHRGLRLVNAEVGAVCQSIYLGCSALGLGCGALLGFDNAGIGSAIGLENHEDPLLLMVGGPEHMKPEAFQYRMY